ncbi:DUF6099 family protein [Streptomyces fuscigenes]|uniref:DUF6099 family protein n=1 Tax=Streptomyces fuscigenes TaxID=1528880 RepID=UPI001F466011|nr:DUF6099 family protein [Streptomyces fuscigenes]MCF3962170.1 DUF6099 family protein [Streptomyces fuscigenes]
MDAVRIAEAARDALAMSGTTTEVVAEAWQAQALAQALGDRLAAELAPPARSAARGLAEAGERGRGPADHPALRAAGGIRAAALTVPVDAPASLRVLGTLLDEIGTALVLVATVADDAWVYWQCMEAIDAAADSGDRVLELLRILGPRERDGPTPEAGGTDEAV